MPSQIQNIHGRKWGRGIRPWLLLPKYICVSLIIGGLFAVGVLTAVAGEYEPAQRDFIWLMVSRIFRLEIIPGTIGAIFFGFALSLENMKVFWRMRWFRLKLLLVATIVPLMHTWLSIALHSARSEGSAYVMVRPTLAAIAGFTLIAVIGRLKPRLGQKYGTIVKPTMGDQGGSV